MKLTIIGGGNMGGAIARGLVSGNKLKASDITVVDVNQALLDGIKEFDKNIITSGNCLDAVAVADVIVLAVKPWTIEGVLDKIKSSLNYRKQLIVSIASGISFAKLNKHLEKKDFLLENEDSEVDVLPALFRVMPNTAVSISESMTFIASSYASPEQDKAVLDLFSGLGKTMLIEEEYIAAATALSSCGIAFAFRYIRAAMEAGIEIGFKPDEAKKILLQTLQGAIRLLEVNQSHPEAEIDKVTTPGGITIKGLNTMEHYGFTTAVIEGIKASYIKNNSLLSNP